MNKFVNTGGSLCCSEDWRISYYFLMCLTISISQITWGGIINKFPLSEVEGDV